jgi:hypothetical protein
LTSLVVDFFCYCSHFSYLSTRIFGWLCDFVVLSNKLPQKKKKIIKMEAFL